MQCETGEIRLLENETEMINALAHGFEPLPIELQHAAKVKLNGNKSAFVSKSSGGKLSKFARKRRQEARRVAKQARRRNR